MNIRKTMSCLLAVAMIGASVNVGVFAKPAEAVKPIIHFDFDGETKVNTAQHVVDNAVVESEGYQLFIDASGSNKSTFKTSISYPGSESKPIINFENRAYMTLATDFSSASDYNKVRTALDGKFTFEAWVYLKDYTSLTSNGSHPILWVGDASTYNLHVQLINSMTSDGNKFYINFDRTFENGGGRKQKTAAVGEYGVWNHVFISYDPTDNANMPVICLNGVQLDLTASGANVIGEDEKVRLSDKYTSFVTQIGAGSGYYNGIFRSSYSDIKIFDTNLDAEYAKNAFEDNAKYFEGTYNVSKLSNNGVETVKPADKINLKEGEIEIEVDFSNIKESSVTDKTVKVVDENGDDAGFDVDLTSGVLTVNKQFVTVGEYKLVVDKSVLDTNGNKYRARNFEFNFNVEQNTDLRTALLDEIKGIMKDDTVTDEALGNELITNYNYILKIDVSDGSDYSKIINKASVFGALRQIEYTSLEEIATEFVNAVKAQAEKDVQDAIDEVVAASKLTDGTMVETLKNLLFVKYQPVFKLDMTDYDLIGDQDKVIEKMANLDAEAVADVVDAFNNAVQTQKQAEVFEDLKAELAVVNGEGAIAEVVGKYNNILNFDLKNEDYLAVRGKVLDDIKNSTASDIETMQKEFYQSILLHSLNAVEAGDRESTLRVLGDYDEYMAQSEDYIDLNEDEMEELATQLNGETYEKYDLLEKAIADFAKEIVGNRTSDEEGSGTGTGTGNGGYTPSPSPSPSSPSKGDGNNYLTPPVAEEDQIPPTEMEVDVPFTDIESYGWAFDGIEYLYKNKILAGKTVSTFCPGDKMTREEFAKVVALAFGYKSDSKEQIFADVAESDWSFEYITALNAAGIISGKSKDKFDKSGVLKRCEMAVILERIAKDKGIDLDTLEMADFDDMDSVPAYAKAAVKLMQEAGIINGVGANTFKPMDTVNRAAAVKVIYAMIMAENGGNK